jgi:hypothetical protein
MQDFSQYLFRIWNHGAKFQATERAAVATGSRVTVDDWAVVARKEQANYQQQRGQEHGQRQCTNDIKQSFREPTGSSDSGMPRGPVPDAVLMSARIVMDQRRCRGGLSLAQGRAAFHERSVNFIWAQQTRSMGSVRQRRTPWASRADFRLVCGIERFDSGVLIQHSEDSKWLNSQYLLPAKPQARLIPHKFMLRRHSMEGPGSHLVMRVNFVIRFP